jgi:ABC-2 type transport system permease protein
VPTRTTPAQAARAFRWLRWRLTVNSAVTALHGSRLRLSMLLICSAIFWTGLFGLFFEGFQFIGEFIDLSNTIVEYLFSLFFLSLLVMLFFSTGILTYTGLFQSREAAYRSPPRPRPTGSSPTSSSRRSGSRAGGSCSW